MFCLTDDIIHRLSKKLEIMSGLNVQCAFEKQTSEKLSKLFKNEQSDVATILI